MSNNICLATIRAKLRTRSSIQFLISRGYEISVINVSTFYVKIVSAANNKQILTESLLITEMYVTDAGVFVLWPSTTTVDGPCV